MKKIMYAAIGFTLITGTVFAEPSKSLKERVFEKMDVDVDGYVTLKEFTDFYVPLFKQKDDNKDGVLDEREFGHSAFKSADTNKDKVVDPAEDRALRIRHFKKFDKDKDGKMTLDEYYPNR